MATWATSECLAISATRIRLDIWRTRALYTDRIGARIVRHLDIFRRQNLEQRSEVVAKAHARVRDIVG
jgi:hypothetical protein